uniref:Retinoblastoma-associated protein B-box domain-containing protein n=1 Tax=Neogobius melanostomus TaxID=47308 RepID=A0A8C6S6U8_9GOBI
MMDRHLDQLLMCAVYVITKVTKEDKSFQNIMKCYRTQPQANSDVYRNVWRKKSAPNSASSASTKNNSTISSTSPSSNTTTTTTTATSNTTASVEEERGDLIHFYNNVYIKQMRHFALRYSRPPALLW